MIRNKNIILIPMLLLIAALVLGAHINTGSNHYYKARFVEMIDGKAYKPFVSRCLVPLVVRNISRFVTAEQSEQINRLVYSYLDPTCIEWNVYDLQGMNFTYYLIFVVIAYMCIVGFGLVMKGLINHFYALKQYSIFIAILSVIGLPAMFRYYSYPYDMANLFLFSLTFYLMMKERWLLYFLSFALCTINRETSIFLIIIFAITREIDFEEIGLLALQIILYSCIQFSKVIAFDSNPGVAMEFHLWDNFNMAPFTSGTAMLVIALILLIVHNWNEKPNVIRIAFLFTFIPLTILGLIGGKFDEYRMWYEVYPFIVLLIVPSIHSIVEK